MLINNLNIFAMNKKYALTKKYLQIYTIWLPCLLDRCASWTNEKIKQPHSRRYQDLS